MSGSQTKNDTGRHSVEKTLETLYCVYVHVSKVNRQKLVFETRAQSKKRLQKLIEIVEKGKKYHNFTG